MEPVSGIFSSPQKGPSPATRRGEEATLHSEDMDIDDTFVPGRGLKGNRASLPPPRSRSPIKTSIGATPRRSLGRVARSSHKSDTPEEDADVAVRRLDFHQEVSVQETPALSGSGARRELARRDVYDIERSPSLPGDDEDAIGSDDVAIEQSFAGLVDEDAIASGDIEETLQEELSRVDVGEEDPVPKQPGRRGRKRKSDGLESAAENESSPAVRSKRIRTANAIASAEKAKKAAEASAPKPRGRPPRQPKQASDPVDEEEDSAAEAPFEDAPQAEGTPAPPPKKRGRPAKAKEAPPPEDIPEGESSATAKRRGRPSKDKPAKTAQPNETTEESISKKPSKSGSKAKGKATEKPDPTPIPPDLASGKLVDSLGNPIARDELDKRSVTSAGSAFRRARQLSVFREVGPDEIGRVGRTGRHHVKPIDFWMNERAEYARDGTLKAITHHLDIAEEPRRRKTGAKKKGRKRAVSEEEDEEEEEKEEWEVNEGVFVGAFRDFDVTTETTGEELLESSKCYAAHSGFPFMFVSPLGDSANISTPGSTRLGRKRHRTPTSTERAVQIHQARLRGRPLLLQLGMHRPGRRRFEAQQEFQTHAYGLPCDEGEGRGHCERGECVRGGEGWGLAGSQG